MKFDNTRSTNTNSMLNECCGCTEYSNCYSMSCSEIHKAIEKLKLYEDTGLEPDEIKRRNK